MSDEIMYQSELEDWFGDPRESSFAEDYLITMDFSEFANDFKHVKDYEGNKWGYHIYGHYMMEEPLKNAFRALITGSIAKELKTYDGCFNIRLMKGGNSLSVHSWGLAVDFNAATNPFGGKVSFSKKLILCFAEAGFEAGALWSRPDGMHFQLPLTSSKWLTSDNPLRPIPLKF